MPLIDGLEVCRQLKSDPATRLTPVVLVSGQTELTDRINGIEAGADDYLSKPVHPHELRAASTRSTCRRSSRRSSRPPSLKQWRTAGGPRPLQSAYAVSRT